MNCFGFYTTVLLNVDSDQSEVGYFSVTAALTLVLAVRFILLRLL